MKKPLFVRVAYEWRNPYTKPPDGKPRVLAEVFYPYSEHPKLNIPEIESLIEFGSGYTVAYSFIGEPLKQLDQHTLADIRKKRLKRRVEKKYPLFASEIIADEISKNPDYYDGITRDDLQEKHDEIIRLERESLDEIRKQFPT